MEMVLEIWKHIEELYTANPQVGNIQHLAEKNPTRVEAWREAFKSYDLSDVLNAIDEYWNFKSSKSRPNVAQIRAILNGKKAEQKTNKVSTMNKIADYDPAQLMRRDIELKRNRHLLPVYEKAVRYIAEDLLVREIPAEQWRRLDLAGRCKLAWEKGLFSQLDDVLVLICRKYWDKDYQYPSESELESHKMDTYVSKAKSFIASHYRTDEARQARNDNSLDLESVFGF